MTKLIKKIAPISLVLLAHNISLKKKWKNELDQWNNLDEMRRGPAPHLIKQQVIAYYQDKYKIETFVETGSLYGDMIKAQKNRFKELFTVELSKELYRFVCKRFARDQKVHCLHGDSGKVLHDIIPRLKNSSIFWLDGHYSGGSTAKGELDCPIFGELGAIIRSNHTNVVLIDDAREFVGKGDYPTILQLKAFLNEEKKEFDLEVQNDIIRIMIKN